MKKRFLMVLAGLAAVFVIGYLAMLFIVSYEPTPDQSDVEEMVHERGLVDFGEVEGAFLLTPRNYGYYDSENIYVVEQYLDKGGDYSNQYAVIEKGTALTDADEPAIEELTAKETFQNDYVDDFQVLSKHRVTVYKNEEKTEEHWFFKVSYKYDGDYSLSFVLPETNIENRFNFFAEGYEQFLQF
ncbi:hypothetical protein [Planococcus halotolerans]|uniref:Uncharacterized protein n=1 Tax=Planococcus halotolerans TaxID=2233542 RepID=A0A365KWW0_9BACL|nr:hypothetical protein [Planococcus halotolerans]RAZ77672.1 hypothetical protein DP120_09315 [Planococcus halotolerans]